MHCTQRFNSMLSKWLKRQCRARTHDVIKFNCLRINVSARMWDAFQCNAKVLASCANKFKQTKDCNKWITFGILSYHFRVTFKSKLGIAIKCKLDALRSINKWCHLSKRLWTHADRACLWDHLKFIRNTICSGIESLRLRQAGRRRITIWITHKFVN